MNIKVEMMLEEYDQLLPTLEKLKNVIDEKMNAMIEERGFLLNSYGSRIKTRKSLQGKLELKGDKYSSIFDLTDLVGCRVVTFYGDEVDKIAGLLSDMFEIDWDNSIDKRKVHDVDSFGYMSLHYICKLPESAFKDDKYPEINNLRFEIQMRTALQHVWASIYHDTGYKSDVEVPRDALRSLSRLAGLLEIADQQFNEIKFNLDDYRRKVKALVQDGNLDEVELNWDSFKAYLELGGIQALTKKIAGINNMEIQELPYTPYLSLLKSMKFETVGDVDRMFRKYEDKAFKFAVSYFADTDIDIIASTTGLYVLILIYIICLGGGEVGVGLALESLFGKRKRNIKQAERIVESAAKVGISKEE